MRVYIFLFLCSGAVFSSAIHWFADSPEDVLQKQFMNAVEEDDDEQVNTLIRIGANVNVKHDDEFRSAPLHIATRNGNSKMVALLINGGADVNARDKFKRTPIYYTATLLPETENSDFEIAEMLIRNGADVNLTDQDRNSPLYAAVAFAYRKLNLVELYVRNGANVNVENIYHELPIIRVALNGNTKMIDFLVKNGADVNQVDYDGDTALCFTEDEPAAEILIQNYADVNHRNFNFRTPLHHVAERGNVGVAQILIDNGANIYAQDKHGRTPLDLAIEYRRPGMIRLLRNEAARRSS